MPLVLSVIFLCLSVTLLAQASITIFTYNKEQKAKDLNFYWSCMVLVFAIIGVIASMIGVFANRGAATAGGGGENLSAQQMSLANKLEMEAAASSARAAKAAEGAKLANALGATVGQLEK